ncbi:hypothetical protein [Nocardioides baekrokdamisoli]|uniref:hypothetical protein n=1 Tax=Nocardioides baekrokdamisoli TaxID=1804624 RepID=UPI0013DDFD25|nr:hypothetical protein [Nocardioides baekrokdamisoli]
MNSAAPRNARVRLIVTVGSVLVILASIVAIVLVVAKPAKSDGAALADQRAAASSAANALVQGQYTFDKSMLQGSTMPAFRAKVEAVVTPKYDVTFQLLASKVEAVVQAAGLKSTIAIWSTGVAAISSDRATVLVVGAYTQWLPKTKGGTDYRSAGEVPFRDVLSLVNVNGKWLVDNQAPAEGMPPTAPPAASATSGASK